MTEGSTAVIVEEFSDAETSGSTPVHLRPGSAALMLAAKAGRIDSLVIESLSRLSRDPADQEYTIRRLEYAGVRVVSLQDGYDSQNQFREEQRFLTGFTNRAQLRQISQATRRGLAGQVERGFHPGGKAYGYCSTQEAHGHKLVIDEEQAIWVRWIFERYAGGDSPQKIVFSLNAQRVASPAGGTWAVGALYGSPAKGTGILNNQTYVGQQIWNRSTWLKNPDTGKKKRLENPESEWKITDRPDLRIIEQQLWNAVRSRMDTPTRQGGGKGKGKSPTSLLGGILICGQCGGAIVAVNSTLYGCAARKDRGPSVCAGVYAKRKTAEDKILATLRDELLSPQALAEIHAELRASQEAKKDNGYQIAETERQIKNLVEAITMMGISPELARKLKEKQAEKACLIAEQAHQAAPAIGFEEVFAQYKALLDALPAAVMHDVARARTILRELLGEIKIEKEEGVIYAILKDRTQRLMMAAGSSIGVVAGTGFEPMTFGL